MKLIGNKQKEIIDLKTFCLKEKQYLPKSTSNQVTAYSLYLNPLAFLDIHFALAAGAVVLVAVLEKKLANHGIISLAAILSGILQVAFPLVALGSILILISKLGMFL
ncbi:hypothetical protein AB7M70_011839 [Bradyrhizobium japonicum]